MRRRVGGNSDHNLATFMGLLMLNNWAEMVGNVRQAAGTLEELHPKMLTAFRSVNEAQGGVGVLDAKTRELIALAVAVTTRCDGCIGSHALAATKAGASEAEVAEALGVAIALNAGAAYIYSLRALDAVKEFNK
jgi:AhpD family alkylhydroperoxidase